MTYLKQLSRFFSRIGCKTPLLMLVTIPLALPAYGGIYGDFNGDGYSDLTIGVPHEDIDTITNAGAVHVLYGSIVGLQASGVGAPDDQFWHQDRVSVPDTAETDDRFGLSLGAGDFNGDGYDDLAIGVPYEDVESIVDAGAVHVLYGSATGLQASGTGGPDDQFWHQNNSDILDTAERGDRFGWSLSAGDFNNDGYDDLAIGVPYEAMGTLIVAGAVHVLYGSASGLQASGVDGPDDQFWHQDSPGVPNTTESLDDFGRFLSVGDFNSDGYDDLAIGVPDEDMRTLTNAGAVHVLYGSASGLQASGVGGPDDQFWHQNSPGVPDTTEANDYFGSSLSAGDFNNDGYDDLAIGAFREDIGTVINAGAVHVLYGSSSGLQASGVGGPDDQFWHQDSPGVLNTIEANDYFGLPLSAGDFNNDGYDDLAIGVPDEDTGTLVDAGAVHILYGSASGLQASGVGGPDDRFGHQNSPGVLDTTETGDLFGSSLSAGDFNNDGYADLAIGVFREDLGLLVDAGAVHVLYGSAGGLQASGVGGPDDQFWHQDSPGVLDTAEPGDGFGMALRETHVDGHQLQITLEE